MKKAKALLKVAARLALLIPVVLLGLLMAVSLLRVLPYEAQRHVIRTWSKLLLAVLGIRVCMRQEANPEHHGLVVANHVSWVDAFVLGSVFGAKFVVRSDVARWPILGPMVRATGALFVDRSSARSLQQSCQELAKRLAVGQQFAVFPEGATSDGTELLTFRSNFFEASLQATRPVTVVAIRYLCMEGRRNTIPNYAGDMTFLDSLMNILAAPERITASATVTEVLRGFECRKQMALTAQESIRGVVCAGSLA